MADYDDEQGSSAADSSSAVTESTAARARSTVARYASSALSWFSSSPTKPEEDNETSVASSSEAGSKPWWSAVISKEALDNVSKKATDFIRAQLMSTGGAKNRFVGGGGAGDTEDTCDDETLLNASRGMSVEQGEEVFAIEDGQGLNESEIMGEDAELEDLLSTEPGTARAETAELQHWLMEHDCGAVCESAELMVSRGVNLKKLLGLAPDALAYSMPFVGLGHRCLLQHTLTKFQNCSLNVKCLASFDEFLQIEAKFAANLLTLREFWKEFPGTLDLQLYTSSTGTCPRNKDELCTLYDIMYGYSAAAVDALQALRDAGRNGGTTANELQRHGAQGEQESDSVRVLDFLTVMQHHIPFKSAGGFTYSALFESLDEFVKRLENPSSTGSAPKGQKKANNQQKADMKRARQLVQEFNQRQAQIPAPSLNSILIAPLQNFFHTRNVVLKLFEDLSADVWVSDEAKAKAEEVVNKCTQMLKSIDQDFEIPVQGRFHVSPDERRGFRKARFAINSDYVCWSLNGKVFQRSWNEYTVSMSETSKCIRFTKRSGATGDDVFVLVKPKHRRMVWLRTLQQFEQDFLRKQKERVARIRSAADAAADAAVRRLGGGGGSK